MKICVLMPAHWSATLGGAEIQMRYLMHHLRQSSHHEISLVCRRATLSVDNGIPIYCTGTPALIARYTYLLDYPMVHRLLRKIDPDVVYTRVASPLVGYAARYCNTHGKRLVHHIARMDDVMPRELVPIRNRIQSFERPIYEYGLRQADAVITQASYQADLLREHFGRTDAEVIPNYHPAPPKKDKTDAQGQTVLWVANLKAAKRPEIFVLLAETCADLANAQFIMVGAVQDRRYESMLEQSASLRNFRYMGPLPLEEVNQLMDSADIFVNTSTSFGEGFPNTFIQAWLRRVAVVSLEVNPDHIMDDRQIGICSASSIEQLVLDVRTLLLGPDRLQLMTATAYEHAVNNYGAINLSRIQSTLERNAIAAPRKRI